MFMKSGIYKITCIPKGKVYVGASHNISKRFSKHKSMLRRKKHHNPALQMDWGAHGPDAFVFSVLSYENSEDLIKKEQEAIDFHQATDPACGYNILPAYQSSLGSKVTSTTIEKLKLSRIGKKPSLGMKHSEETKAKMSADRKGKKYHSSFQMRRIVESNQKRGVSEKSRIKSSICQVKLNKEQVSKILELLGEGISMKKISLIFNCSAQTICNVKHGKRKAYESWRKS